MSQVARSGRIACPVVSLFEFPFLGEHIHPQGKYEAKQKHNISANTM